MKNQYAVLAAALFATASLLFCAPSDSRAAGYSVTKLARLVASPGREAELEDRLRKTVAFVRKAEPGITYKLYRSNKDPAVFLVYEIYPSQAASDLHSNVTLPAFYKEYGPRPEGLLARPLEFDVLQPLSD